MTERGRPGHGMPRAFLKVMLQLSVTGSPVRVQPGTFSGHHLYVEPLC